jgi:hypothetical protein
MTAIRRRPRRPGPTPMVRYGAPLLAVSVGCQVHTDDGPDETLADLPTWHLAETLRIEPAVPGGELTEIRAMAVADEGVLFVLQHHDHNVRAFDARSGDSLFALGRRGEGPGEFTSPLTLGLRADTLWVSERGRIHYFGPDGTVLRTERVDFSPTGSPGPVSATPLSDGWRLLTPEILSFSPSAAPPDRIQRYLYPRGESRAPTTLPGREFDRVVELGDRMGYPIRVHLPGTGYEASVVDLRGTSILVMDQSHIVDGIAPLVSLVRLAHTGDTVVAAHLSHGPADIPDAVYEHLVRTQADRLAPAFRSVSQALNRIQEAIHEGGDPVPFAGIVPSRAGGAWLQPQRSSESPWVVLDQALEPIARAVVPADVTLRYIDDSHAWGTERDVDGWHHIIRYQIERRPTNRRHLP